MARNALMLRGRVIAEDGFGNVCLDDIWELSKRGENQAPKQWRRTRAAEALIEELQKKVVNSHLKENTQITSVIYSKLGRGNKGTFAHPVLAGAYAGYLSPKLEIEVREVWLRYRSGDATLADEILQRATKEQNLWAGVRAISRAQRISYTDVLRDHGVEGRGYMDCTEAVYQRLFGGKSYELRNLRGLPKKANLRDNFTTSELSFVMAAEALSSERIAEEDRQGNVECISASARSASAIRRAIDDDRSTRQRNLGLR